MARGESEGARLALERSFAVADAMELPRSAGMALFNLGWASLTGGELGRARAEFDDSLARFTVARWEYGITRSLTALAAVALREHSVAEAVVQLRKSLALSLRLGDLEDGVWALELYGVSRAEAAPEDAARLLGAAEAGRERLGISPEGLDVELHDRAMLALEQALGAEGLARAWHAGRRLGIEPALDRALLDAGSR